MLLNPSRSLSLCLALVCLLLAGCIRHDASALPGRKASAEYTTGDPMAKPSIKELREARAVALMEADILASGRVVQIRPDGSSSNPGQVKFASAPGALNLEIAASESLNAIDGEPHALTLVIYQLSDRVAFDSLGVDEKGMGQLLDAKRFDESVKHVRRFFIQPGSSHKLSLERGEDARHVAIVAGYHLAPPYPAATIRVFSYGIGQYAIPGETALHREKFMFRPLPLNLKIELGGDAMFAQETGSIYHNMHDSIRVRSQQYHTEYYRTL